MIVSSTIFWGRYSPQVYVCFRWAEEAPELTGRTDGNKRVVFPDRGVIDGLKQFGDSLGSRAVSASCCVVFGEGSRFLLAEQGLLVAGL